MKTQQAVAFLSWLAYAAASPAIVARALPAVPSTYAALGDSFSAGIGAGKYSTTNDDGNGHRCKRFDGSYPQKVFEIAPLRSPTAANFFFRSCSGDVLDNIDAQITAVGNRKVDFVTLSISGNDFGFGDVVRKCVYAVKVVGRDSAALCQTALANAQTKINDATIWAKYNQKVTLIRDRLLNPNFIIMITGYAKFFAAPVVGDACDNLSFLRIVGLGALKMTAATRTSINSLVTQVNANIQSRVVTNFPGTVSFIDIDSHFENHRFCEAANAADPIGANDDNVWFNDLRTTLEESSFVGSNSAEESGWQAWQTDLGTGAVGLPGTLQQSSSFHPKKKGHYGTALKIALALLQSVAPTSIINGPNPNYCIGVSPGGGQACVNIPDGCYVVAPQDNTVPPVRCPNNQTMGT
ncbi:MAG: hypothetical protein M1839_006129 [Geoglossum umbratile]|nr:MAG: hypothetical protein M1839_006129 [Geoglossum umbratile]